MSPTSAADETAPWQLSMSFVNRREELIRVLETVERTAERLGLCPRDQFALNLVVDEIATNAIEHAYPRDEESEIELRVGVEGETLVIQLEDHGVEFNPLEQSAPSIDASIEEREIGGLGIHLVRETVEDMTYERRGHKNCLTLLYRLTAQPGS